MLAGRRTWRWLRVFIQHLPPESHTMTALRNGLSDEELAEHRGADPAEGRWSQLELLIAQVVDVLRRQEYAYLKANGAKRLDEPDPLPRPGVRGRKKKPDALTDQSAAVLFELINGGAA